MDNKEIKSENIESTNNENVSTNSNNQLNADFSQIFNMESEETPINEADLPKEKNLLNESMPKLNVPTIPDENKEQIIEKKKSDFNGEEKILYEIQPEKESSPVIPILFFICLIAFIFALPYISDKVVYNDNPNKIPPQPTNPIVQEEFYYFNKSSVRAQKGTLEFTNFVKSHVNGQYNVTFTLTNVGEKIYQFDKKYYLVMYEEDKIVYRALIHSFNAIGAMAAQEVNLIINQRAYERANKFKIEEILSANYPEIKLDKTDGEYKVLDCNYKNNEVKYYFLENKLAKIKETYHETSQNNPNFSSNKSLYRTISTNYKQVEELNSVFVETDDYFTMINEFELKSISDAKLSQLKVYRFFKYNEAPKVVSFELEAQGYTCS